MMIKILQNNKVIINYHLTDSNNFQICVNTLYYFILKTTVRTNAVHSQCTAASMSKQSPTLSKTSKSLRATCETGNCTVQIAFS